MIKIDLSNIPPELIEFKEGCIYIYDDIPKIINVEEYKKMDVIKDKKHHKKK